MIKCLNESSNRGSIRVGTKLKSKNGMASVNDIYVSLLTKSCVIALDNGDRFKVDDLIDYIEKGSIEIVNVVKEDKLNYNNSEMKKLRNAVRGIVVDSDEEFISMVDNMINNEPMNYVPETRKLKNAIDSAYVDSDEELRKLVLDVAADQGIISKPINESKDTLKDLSDVTNYKRGFKDFDSLEKYLNSKGYEVADNGDDYIDIASPDGYRYSFDLDYSSEAPGGRLSIGEFIDRDEE